MPFSFSNALQMLYVSVLSLKFTQNGIRIQNIPNIKVRRAKSTEMMYRSNKTRNVQIQSQQVLSLAKPKNKNDFGQKYQKLEAEKQQEVDLLNPNVAREIGKKAPLAPGPIHLKNQSIPGSKQSHHRSKNSLFSIKSHKRN